MGNVSNTCVCVDVQMKWFKYMNLIVSFFEFLFFDFAPQQNWCQGTQFCFFNEINIDSMKSIISGILNIIRLYCKLELQALCYPCLIRQLLELNIVWHRLFACLPCCSLQTLDGIKNILKTMTCVDVCINAISNRLCYTVKLVRCLTVLRTAVKQKSNVANVWLPFWCDKINNFVLQTMRMQCRCIYFIFHSVFFFDTLSPSSLLMLCFT